MKLKRLLSLLLALVLTVGALPLSAMTVSATEPDSPVTYEDLTTALGFEDFYGYAALKKLPNADALIYAYEAIVVGIEQTATEIPLNEGPAALSEEELQVVWEAYTADFAHHFWSDGCSFRCEDTTVTALIPEYNMTGDKLTQARSAFDSAAQSILSGVKSSWSEFEKELYIHDTLAKKIRYAEGTYSHNAYGALVKGVAVCEGYAEALQYLLHKVGIQSFLVIGTGAGEAHKWNCVRINGNYYHVDLTWDDQDSVTYHAFLNVTDAQILEEHTITKPGFALPSCTATTANYFAVKGGMLTKPYSVSTIAKLLKDGKGRAHVFLPGDPEEFGTWYGSNIDAIAEANGLTNGYYYGFEGLGREIVLILTSLNITQQPQSVAVKKGATATVTFTAEGEGLTYQWYYANKGEKTFTLTTSFTGDSYSLEMNEACDGRRVYCVVTDKYGNSLTTNTVTLRMLTDDTSGSCGDDVTWSYENNTLTISGNGYMDVGESAPWLNHVANITAIVIEDGVKNISEYAFASCNNVKTIHLGKDVANIDNLVFTDCTHLQTISVSPENPKYTSDAQGYLYTKDMKTLVYVPAYYEKIQIPSGVTVIDHFALSDCAVGALYIPKTITYIGVQFFEYILLDGQVYYEGTSEEWKKITIEEGHSAITQKITYEGDKVNILSAPTDLTLEIGEKATLSVNATGAGLKYHWYMKPFNSSNWTKTSVQTSTYPITMTAELSGAQFYCLVVNNNYHSQQTKPITVSMPDHADKAVIKKHPARAEAYKDEIITFSVTATGAGLTYQWYYKPYGGNFTLDPTQTSNTYTLVMNKSMDDAQVYCVVTDKFGCSIKSQSARMEIKNPLVLILQPRDATARLGESVLITLTASGDNLRYRWYYANKGSDTFVESITATSDYYSSAMTEACDGRRLYCVITDSHGKSVTTNTVTITKRKDDSFCGINATWSLSSDGTLTISGTGPMYDFRYPDSAPWSDRANSIKKIVVKDGITGIGNRAFMYTKTQTVSIPDSVTFIGANAFWSNGNLTTVILPKNLTTIGESAFNYCSNLSTVVMYEKVTAIDKYAFSDLALKNVYYTGTEEQWEEIYYQPHNNEDLHNATKHYNTVIEPVSITKQPVSETVVEGRNTNVSVSASGIGLTYQWYYKEKGSSKFSLTTSFTGPTYSVQMIEARNGRQLYCVITDIFGNSVTSDTITITMIPKAKITKQPASVKVGNGQKATVSVQATGDGLSYQWYYKNKGETAFKKSSNTTNTYSATMSTTINGSQVYCVVTDEYGNSVKSNTVTISLKFSITKQPQSVTVIKNKTAKISVSAEGEGLTYQWYYKTKSGKSFKKLSSAKSSSYSIKMTSSKNGRQMYCIVKDKYGNTIKTSTVTLKVAPKVKITKNVASSVKVNAGKAASVYVKASGDGLKYTWYYKNKGAKSYSKSSVTTATYTTTMSASVNGRKVYCVVTDKYGQTTKSKTSTLYAKTTITKQPTSVNITNGKTAKVTVSAAGEKLTYKWYYKNPGSKSFKRASSIKGSTYSCTMSPSVSGRQVYCVVKSKYGGSIKTNVVTLSSSAKCGNSVYWTWDGSGTLTITGSGAMFNYEDGKAPWNSIKSSIKTVKISSGVTTVGARAFKDCTNITSVALPATLTDIKEWAFKGCEKLTSISIPNGVKTIGAYAFSACVKLKHIVLSDALQSIGEWAFNSCHSITYVYLGGSLTRIYNGAFSQCYALTDLFYGGTEYNWLALRIDMNNLELEHAAKQYVTSRNDLPV